MTPHEHVLQKRSGRMIFDLTPEIQKAIKLRAVKSDMTTGEVVSAAIKAAFGKDLEEARQVLGEAKGGV
jgi:hypothetical protein